MKSLFHEVNNELFVLSSCFKLHLQCALMGPELDSYWTKGWIKIGLKTGEKKCIKTGLKLTKCGLHLKKSGLKLSLN